MVARDDTTTEDDDDEVVVYGVNSGRHQLIYNTSMWGLDAYGKEGSGKDRFRSPKGVACDPAGNVYVADCGNDRIVHLFNPERRVHWVKAFDGADSGGAGLSSPSQVAVDEDGNVYVSDTGNRRLVVFKADGHVLREIPAHGAFRFVDGPTTLAVADGRSCWSYFRSERAIFCADSGGRRIRKLSLDGKVSETIYLPVGYRAFYGAVDYYHNFWVTDTNNHCILKFDHNLDLLDTFGTYGNDDNQFAEPRGIAIWKRYGQTFVAERNGAQYYWIGTELRHHHVRPDSARNGYLVETDLTEYSYVSLMRSRGGEEPVVLRKRHVHPGRRWTVFRLKPEDVSVRDGLLLRVEPTYSSYTYYHWDCPVRIDE